MTTPNTPMIQNNFPTQLELQNISQIARTAAMSKMYEGVGGEAKIMMILLAAKELGVGPCQALNGGIWSIQGKVEISARLMNGLIRRAGHSIKIKVSNDEECTLLGTRTDGDSFECSFTMNDAVKAGLAGGNVWKKYPADMIYNRCMSRLARRLFSDVISECYVEGEISEAKEVEKEEKRLKALEQAECEVSDTKPDNCPTVPQKNSESAEIPLHQETKIDSLNALKLQEDFMLIDAKCKDAMWGYLKKSYGVDQGKFDDIPESQLTVLKNGIQRNIEFNAKAVK